MKKRKKKPEYSGYSLQNIRCNIQQHLTPALGTEVPGRKTWIPKHFYFISENIFSSNYISAKSRGPNFHLGVGFPMPVPIGPNMSTREEIYREEQTQSSN